MIAVIRNLTTLRDIKKFPKHRHKMQMIVWNSIDSSWFNLNISEVCFKSKICISWNISDLNTVDIFRLIYVKKIEPFMNFRFICVEFKLFVFF